MADESLIKSAMAIEAAKTTRPVTTISSIAKDIGKKITDRVNKAAETTRAFMSGMPEDFKAEKVPAAFQGKLEQFLKEQKAEFAKQAKVASQYANDPTNPKYMEAIDKMNEIKTGFTKIDNSLQSLATKREQEAKNMGNLDPAMTSDQVAKSLELVGEEFYNHVDISLDGLTYTDNLGNTMNTDMFENSPVLSTQPSNDLMKLHTAAYEYGEEGEVIKVDDQGKPANHAARVLSQGVNNILSDKKAAASLIFTGVPGDASGDTKYIDVYAEKNADLPRLEDGSLDKDSEEYKVFVDEVKKNPPIEEFRMFLMKTLSNTNTEGTTTESGELD